MTDILGPANAEFAVTVRPSETRAFGPDDTWFRDCTSDTVEDGTDIEASWLNAVVAALRAVHRANGNTGAGAPVVAEDNADGALLAAIQHMMQRRQYDYAADTGAANALVVTLAPALAEYKARHALRVLPAFDNTGSATINVNGRGLRSILRWTGEALRARDIRAGVELWLVDDGAQYRALNAPPPGAKPQSLFARFTTPGAFSWTIPAGVTGIGLWVWAAGGGGGFGAAGTPGGAGAGGSAGAFFRFVGIAVTPGQSVTGTIGAGGAAGISGTAGQAGANTAVTVNGVTYTAVGGPGGANAAAGAIALQTAAAASPSAGDIVSPGENGAGAFFGGASTNYAGRGGTAFLGGIGGQAGSGAASAANTPGGGGGGSGNGQAATAGAAGAVWIEY